MSVNNVEAIVIVGAGQAGARVAEGLRDAGFAGSLVLIGDEAERPYERPSLSKEMLLDPSVETVQWVHSPNFYMERDIALRVGTRVAAIDRDAHRVVIAGGETLAYSKLVVATGARVRRLEAAGANDVPIYYVRSLAESRDLRAHLVPGLRVAIVGAGFIGLEVAAAATARGCSATVVEIGDAPLGRVVPPLIRDFYRRSHEAHGVTFRFGTSVTAVRSLGGDAYALVLSDGGEIQADLIVVGIGVVSDDTLARAAGLRCDRGILVDEHGRTDDPDVYAVGDVAQRHQPWLKRAVVLESWHNAQSGAAAVARHIVGETTPPVELPWFWSDQYDINLQMFGQPIPDAQEVVRGNPASRSWLLFQLVDDRIVCAIGINAGRDLRPARELMAQRLPVTPEMLRDTTFAMVELMRCARREHAA